MINGSHAQLGILEESGFLLRPFRRSEAEAFVAAVRESHATVGRWMPWARADYSIEEAVTWFRFCAKARRAGSAYEFGIFDGTTGQLIGGAGANQINPASNMCNLGYWVRESRQREGAATAAVRMLTRYAFGTLNLTRAEIVVAVGNVASLEVARRSGAEQECVARNRLVLADGPTGAHVFSIVPST